MFFHTVADIILLNKVQMVLTCLPHAPSVYQIGHHGN